MVGGVNPSEKYEFVSWGDDIPNIWKNNPNVPKTTNISIIWLIYHGYIYSSYRIHWDNTRRARLSQPESNTLW